MSNIEELKGMLLACAEMLKEASAHFNGAGTDFEETERILSSGFEGTGRDDLLTLKARISAAAIQNTDLQVECLSIASELETIAPSL